MALEDILITRLRAQCSRVLTPSAPWGTTLPYVTWQHIGGQSLRYMDNSASDKRNAVVQINAWATTKQEAFALLLAIEDGLCASSADFTATPSEEASDVYDENETQPGEPVRGAMQTFEIWGARI